MFKIVCLLTRKIGMSMEDFKDHYDNQHVPLAFELIPSIKAHRRNYRVTLPGRVEPDLPGYDVISEIWFESLAGFEAMMAAVSDPIVAAKITADEERFLNRSKSVVYPVEESALVAR